MAKWNIYLVIRVTGTSEICNETRKKSKGIILSGLLAGGDSICVKVSLAYILCMKGTAHSHSWKAYIYEQKF